MRTQILSLLDPNSISTVSTWAQIPSTTNLADVRCHLSYSYKFQCYVNIDNMGPDVSLIL